MAKNSSDKQKEYDARRAGTRGRNFNFIVYPDDLPDNWMELLDESRIRWIEGPLHDKDVFTAEDEQKNPEHKAGELKKAHKHCMAMFESVKNVNQVTEFFKGVFGESDTGSIVGCLTPVLTADRSGSVRYMAHLDNPSKAQYDISDIVGHNGADPQEIIRFSLTETLAKMIEMEKFIEDNQILYLSSFAARIRESHPDWYQILVTKNTYYFSCFIRSRCDQYKEKHEKEKALDTGNAYIDDDGIFHWGKCPEV